jgi:hypothetical protein
MFELSKSDHFVSAMSLELEYYRMKRAVGKGSTIVRIHSGDEFYSTEYIMKWYAIAKTNPDYKFYAFSKQFTKFSKQFELCNNLPNMFITNSLHTGYQNYGPLSTNHTNMFVCPATTVTDVCDAEKCNWCHSKIGAVQHGVFFKQH